MFRRFRRQEPNLVDHDPVGKVVRVTDRIDSGRIGAVLIPVRGGTEEFYARAAPGVAIPAGSMVKVISYAPPRSVEVETIANAPGERSARYPLR